MSATGKRVLIVTYYFPPAGGPAVQRILRFLNHLGSFNWHATILTVKNGDFPVEDESLRSRVPDDVKVYRTHVPEPYKIYRKFTGKTEGEALDLSLLAAQEGSHGSFRERLAILVRNWLFIPDPRIGWLPFAVLRGLRIIRKEKIDLIFSSAPPNTVHLVACLLKMCTGRKWVADFRDPWFKYLVPERKGVIPRKLDEMLGRLVLRKADHCIWVCSGVRREMERLKPRLMRGKESIITNGFEPDQFQSSEQPKSPGFRIIYVGSLYIKYNLDSFIEALNAVYLANQKFRKDLELIFCGRVDKIVAQKLQAAEFGRNIKFLGYLPHQETIAQMLTADLLLLYIIDSAQGKNIPTSKLFEYLGAGRVILALSPDDSDAAEILRETQAGVIVPPADSNAIRSAVAALYKQWCSGSLHGKGDKAKVAQYEIKNLTKRLIQVWENQLKE